MNQQQQTLQSMEQHQHQKRYSQQSQYGDSSRNNIDDSTDEQDLLENETQRQLILKRKRLFSHQHQYEVWRRKQFSYDPASYHYRPIASAANRKRRLYRRQYSCVEKSEGSNNSHDSNPLPRFSSETRNNSFNNFTSYYSFNNSNTNCNINCGDINKNYSFSYDNFNSNGNNYTNVNSYNSSDNNDGNSSNNKINTDNENYNTKKHFHFVADEPSTTISERCTRSRINSAIFVSSEGKGFDSIEFLRRHGSQSVLCRKAKSAENINDDDRKIRFTNNRKWATEDSGNPTETIELTECLSVPSTSGTNSYSTAAVVTVPSNITTANSAIHRCSVTGLGASSHTATVTTADTIIGSISIEAPPPHIQREQQLILQQQQQQQQLQQQQQQQSQESQELNPLLQDDDHQQQQNQQQMSSNSKFQYQNSSPFTRLQNLSTTSTNSNCSSILDVNSTKKSKLDNLPTLSVSGPSPPYEKEEFL